MGLKETAGTVLNAAGAVSSLFGIGEKRQDKRQVEQQKKLNEVNNQSSKEMSDYDLQNKMKMWNDTNYSAQLAQAEKAGVSKAAALGGAGSGAVATTATPTVNGSGAANAAATQASAVQQAMAAAQIANLDANTKKTTVEAEKIGGVDTVKTGAETENIKIDKQFKELQLKIANTTQHDAIEQILKRTQIMQQEWISASAKANIDNQSQGEMIKQIKNRGVGLLLQNAATRQGIKLDEAKTRQTVEAINQKWVELGLDQSGQAISVENMKVLTDTMIKTAGIQAVGNVVKGVMDLKGRGNEIKSRKTRTEIDRYDGDGNHKGSEIRTIGGY